jgi:hypothetical protein
MQKIPITMTRGDTLAFKLTLTGMTASAIYFSARPDLNADYVFQKSLSDGISLIEGSTYRVRVAPEDTATLAPGKYVYDCELHIGEDVYTPFGGTLELKNDVTRNEA